MNDTPAFRRLRGWAGDGATLVVAVFAAWVAAEFAAPRGVRVDGVTPEDVFLLGLVALAVGGGALLLEGLGRFLGILGPVGRVRSLLQGLPWWAVAAFPLWQLFEGAWIREQSWRGPVRGAAIMLLAVLALLWRDGLRRAASVRSRAISALVCLIGAASCAVLDQTLLVGLYPSLHVLWLIAMVASAASVGILVSRRWPRWAVRVVMALALASLMAVLTGLVPGTRPTSRDLLLRRAVVSRKVLALLPRSAPGRDRGDVVDAAILITRTYPHQRLLDRVVPGRRRFNVVLITVDTLRADHCGFMVDERGLTPNLDAFSKECVVFEDAYASYPSTKFSVASLFTGLHPTATSQADGRSSGEDAPLQSRMKQAGWQTYAETAFPPSVSTELDCLAVGWTFSRNADFALGENSDRGDKVVDRALKRMADLDTASPWLFWLHLFDPHAFYVRHPAFDFGEDPAGLYAGEVAFADREVGRFLAALKARGDWDRTIVIVHSDHGQELFERGGEGHGSTLYEEQVHVPLLVRLPRVEPRRITQPVGLVDLAPTLTHLLGLADPLPRNGRSRVGEILADAWPDDPVDLPVFFQLHEGSYGQGELDGIRWRRFKLIENLAQGVFELYDVVADPGERRNLALDRPELLDELVPWLRAEQRVATRSGLLGSSERAETEEDLEDLVSKGYGRRAMEKLRAAVALGQMTEEKQSGVAELLGAAGVEEARSFLIAAARSKEKSLRLAALRGLFFLDGEDVRAALVRASGDDDGATAVMARKLLAIRNEGPPVKSDLARSRGKDLVIDVLAAVDSDAAHLARALVGAGAGTASDQAFGIRYLQKHGDPWLLAGLYARSGFAPWPSGQTKRMAFSAIAEADWDLVFPVVRWVFYKGGRRARETVERKLAPLDLAADLPLMRTLCRESEALLHDAMTKRSFGTAASDVEKLIGLARQSGYQDWGLVLDFIQASLFARTSAADLVRELESIRKGSSAGGASAGHPFLDRWIDLFASRASGAAPRPSAEMVAWDREPVDGVWRGLVRLELDASGGGLIPLGQGQGAGVGFSLSDGTGRPVGEASASWVPWDGLLPGESRLLLLTLSLPEGSSAPAHLHFVPLERRMPLGSPATVLLRP